MSDPCCLSGLDLLLVGLVALLLRVDVTIASNKVMYAAVRSLVLVRTWTETPCSTSSPLLNCLLSSNSRRIASAPVLCAAALSWRWSWLASSASGWSRCPGIDPKNQRSLPLDIHPSAILVERRLWLRLPTVVNAFVPNDCLLERDLLLVHGSLRPATTSSEEVLTILVALLQLPQSHVTAANLSIGLLVEVLVWIRRVQPCRAQVAKVRLAPVADPKRWSEGVSRGGVIETRTCDCIHASFEQGMHKLDTAWCAS